MDLSAASRLFSDELCKSLVPPSHTGNVLVSPLGVLTTLSILMAGSRGNTRSSLASTLKLPSDVPQERLDSFYRTLLSSYKSCNANNTSLVKNKMLLDEWYLQHSPILSSFKQTVLRNYSASIDNVDFYNNECGVMREVNKWVNRSTCGMVKRLFDEPPDPDSLSFLLSSVYFKPKWLYRFHGDGKDYFVVDETPEETSYVVRQFMRLRTKMKHLEIRLDFEDMVQQSVEAVVVPTRSNVSMILISTSHKVMPLLNYTVIFNITRQVVNMSSEWWGGKLFKADWKYISLKMPKFKLKSVMSLKEHLEAAGAGDIFHSPDLSGINGASNLHVSNVKQATAIHVDQDGTKSPPEDEEIFEGIEGEDTWTPYYYEIYQPFVFVIYDTSKHIPILVGKVSDPSQ